MTGELTTRHAVELCELASAENARRRWDPRTWQCVGCLRFSSDAEHRCFAAKPGNRGCGFVNRLWERELHDG